MGWEGEALEGRWKGMGMGTGTDGGKSETDGERRRVGWGGTLSKVSGR